MGATPFGHAGERLSALLDDELDDRAALQVTRHLASCDQCMDELEDLREARSALRGLHAPEPDLAFMLQTVVLGEPAPEEPHLVRRLALAGSGVAVLGVLVMAFVLGADQGTVVPPVDRFVVDHVFSVEGGPMVTPVGVQPSAQP